MILAIDVHYENDRASIAGLAFNTWESQTESAVYKSFLDGVAPYESGSFYLRELPCIKMLLDEHDLKPDVIVIDGFVWLDGYSKHGLGVRLYKELNESIPIIGVAKKGFKGIPIEFSLLRGKSEKPLFVTCIGIEQETAIQNILSMAGENRLPVLLKKVDRLCRES